MTCISGTGIVPFGRGLDPAGLVRGACQAALDDARLARGSVDHVVVANAAAEGLLGIGNVAVWTSTQAGLIDTPTMRVECGPSSGLAALAVADALVAAGRAHNVLVLGWEAMTHVPTAQATEVLARLMAGDEQALGLSLPGLVALLTSAYQHEHGITDEQLAELFITASVTRGQGDEVTVTKSSHHKCGRCWRLLPEVEEDGALCDRCDDVFKQLDAAE